MLVVLNYSHMLSRWPLGWPSLFEREEVIFIYLYIVFLKTHGILRMSSGLRHTQIKPYGWEHSSSIFHVGSEVIQSLANACRYILSVKMFLELWYFAKSFSVLTNQSSSPWSKLHLAGRLLLLLCFLFLDSMRYPCLTLSHHLLLLCVTAFLFQVTNRVQTRTVEEDGRPLLNFIGLWL